MWKFKATLFFAKLSHKHTSYHNWSTVCVSKRPCLFKNELNITQLITDDITYRLTRNNSPGHRDTILTEQGPAQLFTTSISESFVYETAPWRWRNFTRPTIAQSDIIKFSSSWIIRRPGDSWEQCPRVSRVTQRRFENYEYIPSWPPVGEVNNTRSGCSENWRAFNPAMSDSS